MTPPLSDADYRAARWAALPAHRRQHLERMHREKEAKRAGREYRQQQREAAAAAGPHKTCTGCKQSLSVRLFSPKRDGYRPRCRRCESAEAAARKRARQRGWSKAEADAHRAKQRADYRTRQARSGRPSASAARRADVAATWAGYHSLRLEGLIPSDPVVDQEDWEVATQAVRKAWESSGDKQCVGCKQTFPPSAMLPPGPGNFYPGRCNPCARDAWREGYLRTFGRYPAERSRPIVLLDGSEITIGELARRHRERQAGRATRYMRGSYV